MSVTVEESADRVFTSALGGAIEIYSLHIRDRLGFYRALADGAKTSTGLAAETGVEERYVREWLEQQATYGILEVQVLRTRAVKRRGEHRKGARVTLSSEGCPAGRSGSVGH
jgi:hypothetical protein